MFWLKDFCTFRKLRLSASITLNCLHECFILTAKFRKCLTSKVTKGTLLKPLLLAPVFVNTSRTALFSSQYFRLKKQTLCLCPCLSDGRIKKFLVLTSDLQSSSEGFPLLAMTHRVFLLRVKIWKEWGTTGFTVKLAVFLRELGLMEKFLVFIGNKFVFLSLLSCNSNSNLFD